jgi:hypothetical protein
LYVVRSASGVEARSDDDSQPDPPIAAADLMNVRRSMP